MKITIDWYVVKHGTYCIIVNQKYRKMNKIFATCTPKNITSK